MKKRPAFGFCCMVAILLTGGISVAANPFNDVVLRVTFEGDSVNDTTLDAPSTGYARDVVFESVPVFPNGNGRAAVFNGDSSAVNYGPGFGGELIITGDATYHARIKPAPGGGESLVLGGLTGSIINFDGQLAGRVSLHNLGGHVLEKAGKPNVFHDVFFRFRAKSGDQMGDISTVVYESATGEKVAQTPAWKTGTTALPVVPDGDFVIGGGTGYGFFKGSVEQANVWDRFLSDEEIGQIVGVDQPASGNLDADAASELRKAASDRWHQWRKSWNTDNWNMFPIGAWGYFHRFSGSVDEYQMYRDANLTWVIAPLETEKNAAAAGLKTVIGRWSVVPENNDNSESVHLHKHPGTLKKYLDYANRNPSVMAYLLDDEPPSRAAILPYGETHQIIYRHDKGNRIPMVNHMPYPYSFGRGYANLINTYIQLTYPSMLSSDIYPLRKDGSTEEDRFYANYEILRDAALDNDIGLMGFVLNTEHMGYREASESDIYWQVYSLVAYGAKGIWYYNYRHTIAGWQPGLVDGETGKPTATYGYARSVNAEILAIGSLLMDLKSTGVYHSAGSVPPSGKEYSDGVIDCIEQFTGSDFLLGVFENRDDPSDDSSYVMIVNKKHGADKFINDLTLANSCFIKTGGNGSKVYGYDPETGSPKLLNPAKQGYGLKFKGGEGRLLRFSPANTDG